jgi:hypothetical protein
LWADIRTERPEVTDEFPIDDKIPVSKVKRERKDKTQAQAVTIAVDWCRDERRAGHEGFSSEAAERFMPIFDKAVADERREYPIVYTNRKRDFRKRIDAGLARS